MRSEASDFIRDVGVAGSNPVTPTKSTTYEPLARFPVSARGLLVGSFVGKDSRGAERDGNRNASSSNGGQEPQIKGRYFKRHSSGVVRRNLRCRCRAVFYDCQHPVALLLPVALTSHWSH